MKVMLRSLMVFATCFGLLASSASAKNNNNNNNTNKKNPAPPAVPVDPSNGTLHFDCQITPCVDNGNIQYDATHSPVLDVVNKSGAAEFTHFWLLIGIPNNVLGATSMTISTTFQGSDYLGKLFSNTAWTSDKLFSANNSAGGYLNLSKGNPPNPLDAWLPFTQDPNGGNQPGATGYFVYLFNLGDHTIPGSGNGAEFKFCVTAPCSSSSLLFASGTLFDVFATTDVNNGFPKGQVVQSMPQSQAVILNPPPPVPEPAALLLLASGFAGLGLLRRRR